MHLPAASTVLLCAVIVTNGGCRMGVPIHVWQSAKLGSTVGKQVVVSVVADSQEEADTVKQELIARAPTDTGRSTQLIDSVSLQSKTQIQLVSATDEQPNDVALASVARREGADFALRGELLENRNQRDGDTDNLVISWRLTSLRDGTPPAGHPVTVDLETAIDRYPDLAISGDPQRILLAAAVRDTYRLITPSVERDRVQLEIAYLMPGSEQVRRGNAAALAGKWGEAEAIWSDVLQKYPAQVPALHNLALAAVAGQDFTRGKELARKAVRLQPTQLHKQTLVWIELRQREYHQSFKLPDPPEGWFVTN